MLFYAFQKKGFNKSAEGVKIYLFIFQAQSRREWGEEDCRCVGWWNDSHPDRTAELHSPRGVRDAAWWYGVWGQSWGGAPHQEHRCARFTESRMEWQGWSLPGRLQHRYLVIMVDEDFLQTHQMVFFVIVSLKVKYFSVYIAWTLLCCICILILRQEQHCI